MAPVNFTALSLGSNQINTGLALIWQLTCRLEPQELSVA